MSLNTVIICDLGYEEKLKFSSEIDKEKVIE